ncbi:MAG: hypothetical protein ABEJ62_01350 [Candidatus Nanohaloarchaea archaeon]
MVTRESFDGQEAFKCDICGFHYAEREDAEECEEFCETYEGCSTRLAQKALETGG